jgi:hypothetical protein
MTKYVFSYRVPEDYTPGQPETVAAWTAWFESMGPNLVDRGHGVIEPSALGNLGDGTRPGLALVAGGVPVMVDGRVAGAIGVAGAMTGAEDRRIAEVALRTAAG